MKDFSVYTVYLLSTFKLLFWGIGLLFFGMKLHIGNLFFMVGESIWMQIAMVLVPLAGLINLRYDAAWLYKLTAFFHAFLWMYVTLEFAISSNFANASWIRSAVETGFVLFMTYRIFSTGSLDRKSIK